MRVQTSALGWKLYVVVAVLSVLSFIAIEPAMERNPFIKIKNTFSNYAVTTLGLSGTKPETYQGILASVVSKSLVGKFPSAPISIEINVRFKHMKKIKRERDEALRLGILAESKFYPATIRANGKGYRASIRLKGDLADHWSGLNRWSFRIRIKDGRSILGMSQFSIHKPLSRQIPDENIFQTWLRASGNIAPRHEYAQIQFNGDNWGIMNVEEHISKYLLERNGHNESPVFKIGSEDNWVFNKINKVRPLPKTHYGRFGISLFNDREYADNRRQIELYSYGTVSFREWLSANQSFSDTFSIDQFSRVVIAAAIWQNTHGVALNNMRLNLNPFTLKIQPITADQGVINAHSSAYERLTSGNTPFIGELLRSNDFYVHFDRNLKSLKDAVFAMHDEQKRICAVFVFDCPQFKFDVFDENLRFIDKQGEAYFKNLASFFPALEKFDRRNLLNDQPIKPIAGVTYNRHVLSEYKEDGRLIIWNLLPHDVTLVDARMHCKDDVTCDPIKLIDRPIEIPAGFDGVFPLRTTVRVPSNIILNRDRTLVITTKLGAARVTQEISLAHIVETLNPFHALVNQYEDQRGSKFIVTAGNQLTILAGDWLVRDPIYISPDQTLVIKPGASLRFTPDSYILSRGRVMAEGTATQPIILSSENDEMTWAGIQLIQAPGQSIFSHVTIENTRFFKEGVLAFSGGVTFYESDVELSSVTFNKSIAEDALNIVRSHFAMTLVKFYDTRSDAFDSDFSNGKIVDTSFEKIGGDGLDTSGSKITGSQLSFKGIGDKAISVGEASQLFLSGVKVDQALMGVVSKDGSLTEINGFKASDNVKHAAMVYIKKVEYGPAELVLTQTVLRSSEIDRQEGNVAWLNGHEVGAKKIDVEALYASPEK